MVKMKGVKVESRKESSVKVSAGDFFVFGTRPRQLPSHGI